MILGGANLALHWLAIRGKGFGVYWRDPEFPVMLGIAGVGAVALGLAIVVAAGAAVLDAGWLGVFHAVSALTTTGFVTGEAQQSAWPVFAPIVLLVLMLIGGSTGVRSGGCENHAGDFARWIGAS